MKGEPKSEPASTFDELLKEAAATPSVAHRSARPGHTLMNGRFVIERRLGEGGMGVVYAARDEKRRSRVALKALSRVDPAGIYRFKREFRSLADVVHEHLVALHELFAEDDAWFFTMELIDGVPFSDYVRKDGALGVEDTLPSDSRSGFLGETAEVSSGAAAPPIAGQFQESHLRESLAQLAAGVAALHAAGILHRDLKPSNVLVTRAGRVVILDFGLASDEARGDATETMERSIAGTPAYMSPEQARGEQATQASDWYAVGCMLYEALSGRPPFTGALRDVLLRKQQDDPQALSETPSGVPGDLSALCMDLLRRDPSERPRGAEILRRVGVGLERRASSRLDIAAPQVAFVGRERELSVLWHAFEQVSRGESRTIFVQGLSGMGKTTLVERFIERAASDGRALVLRGRCHEREEVPFKAFDGIIDALTRFLAQLDPVAAAFALPRELHTLTRVFPVLRRVPVIAQAKGRVSPVEEPIELRRVAFAALRDLFQRLGDRQPLVLFTDDLHWADEGSALLLSTLLEPPDAPALLFIGAYRSDEVSRSACLEMLLSPQAGTWKERLVELDVGELTATEALELSGTVLGAGAELATQAHAIVADAGGHPYFVTELARSAKFGLTDPGSPETHRTLEGVISARVKVLPEPTRRLLEVVALSGRPVPTLVALDAAGISPDDRSIARTLVTAHLARATRTESGDAIEAYHDRVRATVASAVSAEERTDRHREIVRALRASGRVDPELLVEHLAGAGDFAGARAHALDAAREATLSYAYETAASLYRRALSWAQGPEDEQALQVRLAESLRDAGRAAEAGWAFLEAAQRANDPMRSDLQRLAAEQLILAGHIETGISVFQEVLTEEGLEIPPPLGSVIDPLGIELLAQVVQRGLDFVPNGEETVPADVLRRIDLFWSIGWGLNFASFRGASFFPRHLLAALDVGEPYRVLRGLSVQAGVLAALGVPGSQDVVRRTEEAARLCGDERARFWIEMARSASLAYAGRFHQALPALRKAESILQSLSRTASKELGTVHVFFRNSLWYSGEIGELCRRLPEWLRDAEQRNDLFTAVWMRSFTGYCHLHRDDIAGALEGPRRAVDMWGRPSGDDPIYATKVISQVFVQLYAGVVEEDAIAELVEVVEGAWGSLRLHRSVGTAVEGRAHLQLASRRRDAERHLERAERCAAVVEEAAFPFHLGASAALKAGAAMIRGRKDEAIALLEAAVQETQDPEAGLMRAAVRRCLGELLEGDQGRSLVDAGTAELRAQGIANPARWTAMLMPGFSR